MRAPARPRARVAFVLVLVAAGLLGPGAPASAQPVTIDLCVEAGTLPLPGVAATPVWGFAVAGHDGAGQPTCVGVTPQVPGPVLTVNQGDTVAVVVHNDLAAAVSLEVPGIAVTQGAAPAPAHGSAAFTFVAAAPGTYLYQSPADAGRQLAMGLYGALIVRPPTAGQAYGVSSAYDTEAVTVLSAIDPAFNADPAGYDMHRYAATFWLINGKAYPQTSPIHGLAPGTRVLLRYLNAGFDNTTMVLLGLHQRVLAQDARVLANPFDSVAETIPAGATEDTIAVIPATGTRFPLYNRQLHLTNGTPANPQHTPGGMLTYLQVP